LVINISFSARPLIYAGLILLLAGSLVSCSSTTPALPATKPATKPPTVTDSAQPAEIPPVETTADEAGWSTVKSFTGKEGTTTASFNISGSEWRIMWSVETQTPQYGVFDMLIYCRDGSDMLVDRVPYSPGTESGIVNIDEGGHDYYLKIICANLERWIVDIEDKGDQNADQPVQITEIHYKGMDYNETFASGREIVEWDEYVEIKNLSDSPQNVAGWKLINITKGAPTFIFPMFKPCSCEFLGNWSECVKQCYPQRPCTIEPRHSIRVYTGEPQWESGGYCFYYYPGNIWDNETPDTAVLYNASGQEVSRRSYVMPVQKTAAQ
jgi:hypothetical protein